ncbi:hypothetical protein XPN_2232 [Xanthomonas arboricola pv. pruni MAFF 301427]|nr:hypothetical protein XPN_2232 [Xanthomonas arboricola pv. pruni MAFF 301427]
MVDVVARRLGQLLRLGAGNLHADRIRLAGMIHAVQRFARAPEARVEMVISDTASPAPSRLHSSRNGLSVTPAIGARITFGSME